MKVTVKVLVFILLVPALSFAADASAYYVHAWGYGDLLKNVLEAVKNLTGSGSYKRMIQIAMLIGALIAVLSLLNAKDFSPFMVAQKIIAGLLLYTFIMATPHDMIIEDHSTKKIETVFGVPGVIGLPLMVFSNIERGVSDAFRNALASSPGGMSAIGALPVITGYDLLYSASNYRIQDPKLNQTISSFIESCVFPDILTGFLDISVIGETSGDFWQSLGSTAHPARIAGIYERGKLSGVDGELKPCSEVYSYINNQFNKYTAKGGTGFNQLSSAAGLNAAGDVETMIGTLSSQMTNYNQSGQSFLKNAIAINSFNDAYIATASQVGVDTSALAYGVAKGTETAKMQMTLSGIMAHKYMPITKGFMTVIMIALIPLILLIAIATNSIKKPVGMIVGILTALSLWTVGSQLLDFFILLRTTGTMEMIQAAGGGYTMVSKPIVESGAVDAISMAMSMYWTIPTLSFAVATMSGYSASQMMGGVGATATSATSAAAGEAASGSASFGVTRTNMMSANKMDGVSSHRTGTVGQLSNINSTTAKDDTEISANTTKEQIDSQRTAKLTEDINRDTRTTTRSEKFGGIEFDQGATVINGANGTKTITGTTALGKTEMTLNKDGDLAYLTSKKGKNSADEDIQSKIKLVEEKQEIAFTNRFDFDSASIAQSIASGDGDQALQSVIDFKHDANILKEDAQNYYRHNPTDKQGYQDRIQLANKYQSNYEKALAAYTIAAADGLASLVDIKSINSSGYEEGTAKTEEDKISFKSSLGVKGGGSGVGFDINKSYGSTASIQSFDKESIQVTKNELADRVRREVIEGINNNLNSDEINKNMNTNLLK